MTNEELLIMNLSKINFILGMVGILVFSNIFITKLHVMEQINKMNITGVIGSLIITITSVEIMNNTHYSWVHIFIFIPLAIGLLIIRNKYSILMFLWILVLAGLDIIGKFIFGWVDDLEISIMMFVLNIYCLYLVKPEHITFTDNKGDDHKCVQR